MERLSILLQRFNASLNFSKKVIVLFELSEANLDQFFTNGKYSQWFQKYKTDSQRLLHLDGEGIS